MVKRENGGTNGEGHRNNNHNSNSATALSLAANICHVNNWSAQLLKDYLKKIIIHYYTNLWTTRRELCYHHNIVSLCRLP